MRKVAERFGYSSVLFRYALAAGINGKEGEAVLALNRLCKTHPVATCRQALERWDVLSEEKYFSLSLIARPRFPCSEESWQNDSHVCNVPR